MKQPSPPAVDGPFDEAEPPFECPRDTTDECPLLAGKRRHLEPRPNRPNFTQFQRGPLPIQPSFVPRRPTSAGRIKRFHVNLPFNEGRSIVRAAQRSLFDPVETVIFPQSKGRF
jgi:hypothetical protein